MIALLTRSALGNLRKSPWRTVLILQGIIWGTALAIAPSAIIRGSLNQAQEEGAKAGTDRLLISQDALSTQQAFRWTTSDDLRKRHPEIEAASGITAVPFSEPPILLVGPDSLGARRQELRKGREFRPEDFVRKEGPWPAWLEARVSDSDSFSSADIGTTLTITQDDGNTISAEVVGVLAPRETIGLTDSLGYAKDHPLSGLVEEVSEYLGFFVDEEEELLANDRCLVLPHNALPDYSPKWIEVRAPAPSILELKKRIRADLSSEGYEPLLSSHAILALLYGETLKTMMEMNRIIFAMAILVGTTVVCVLMILTVMERQKEIAIRRVEGARKWHIALQFTTETTVLCFLGGLVGIPLGLLLAFVRCKIEVLSGVTWAMPWGEAGIVLVVVATAGLLGGLLPAWRAIQVDPVVILRGE